MYIRLMSVSCLVHVHPSHVCLVSGACTPVSCLSRVWCMYIRLMSVSCLVHVHPSHVCLVSGACTSVSCLSLVSCMYHVSRFHVKTRVDLLYIESVSCLSLACTMS